MTEEIKEILEYYQKDINKFEYSMSGYNNEQLKTTFSKIYQRYKNHKILLNYITNLQKENQSLKNELKSKPDNEITLETKEGQIMTIIQSERIDMQEKLNKSLEEMYKKYQDYKSRNEKAIEYVEKSKLNQLDTYCKYLYINFATEKIEHLDDLLIILQGGDE